MENILEKNFLIQKTEDAIKRCILKHGYSPKQLTLGIETYYLFIKNEIINHPTGNFNFYKYRNIPIKVSFKRKNFVMAVPSRRKILVVSKYYLDNDGIDYNYSSPSRISYPCITGSYNG